ncbi:hypothetical protein F5Y19DRAFT_479970 [Xylariaceae sp. FL1651]|nr:hypothetical protein F5Y19DRAFT_479970 [Xylariaceae sp. FL1651]
MSTLGSQASEGGKAGHQGGSSTTNNSGRENTNFAFWPSRVIIHTDDVSRCKQLLGPQFDSMYKQKRSLDPESQAKRESLAEQKPEGTIGRLWRNYVSGPGGPNPAGKH